MYIVRPSIVTHYMKQDNIFGTVGLLWFGYISEKSSSSVRLRTTIFKTRR